MKTVNQTMMEGLNSLPKDPLYLELALLPIRFFLQKKILLYFQHITQQNK